MTDVKGIEDKLAELRKPFPKERINKLPRVTCKQCTKDICSQHKKAKCNECGAWTSTQHIHLDYVGHADVTDRLLEVDPMWTWEPVALTELGLPLIDKEYGGLWIKLTVCGVTRLGFGDAATKSWASKGDQLKEMIGDAIRNAAMRFGVSLDLWRKEKPGDGEPTSTIVESKANLKKLANGLRDKAIGAESRADLTPLWRTAGEKGVREVSVENESGDLEPLGRFITRWGKDLPEK